MADCQDGDTCRTWFTCGRGHDFPAVDHSNEACDLEYVDCIAEHYRHECAHDFASGPVIYGERWQSTSCACGLASIHHDLAHSP